MICKRVMELRLGMMAQNMKAIIYKDMKIVKEPNYGDWKLKLNY